MGIATDTLMIVRCPYCKAGIDLRPMVAYVDRRFVCRDCAHTVRPGVPDYRCTCRRCLALLAAWRWVSLPYVTEHCRSLSKQACSRMAQVKCV